MAFDLDVVKRNSKGQIISHQPYRMVVDKDGQRFERPPKSGYWYDGNGNLIAEPVKAEPAKPEVKK